MRWTVLVPLRALPGAKSRLAATVPEQSFEALVTAIRTDTLAAVRATPAVARVVVVGDRAGDGVDLVQRSPGLNGALRDGAAHARTQWPTDGVVALVGDLPALRPGDLDDVLAQAAGHDRSFVPDSAGSGTTVLAARPGVDLEPRFGVGSAARHGEVAVALRAAPSVRTDVDTGDDLAAALDLGVGPATDAATRSGAVVRRSS